MSTTYYLACPARRTALSLGKWACGAATEFTAGESDDASLESASGFVGQPISPGVHRERWRVALAIQFYLQLTEGTPVVLLTDQAFFDLDNDESFTIYAGVEDILPFPSP